MSRVDVVKVVVWGPESGQFGAQFSVPELVAVVDAAHEVGQSGGRSDVLRRQEPPVQAEARVNIMHRP